jgi:hypothetical protein
MSRSILTGTYAAIVADVDGAAIDLSPGVINEVSLYVGANATWGSGTLKLQVSPDGGTTWLDLPATSSWTSGTLNKKLGVVNVVHGTQIRLVMTGSTTPSLNIMYRIARVRFGQTLTFAMSVDGSTAAFTLPGTLNTVTGSGNPNPDFGWTAYGTWNGATVTLQGSPDGGTSWFNVSSTAVATANAHKVESGVALVDSLFRFTLSDDGASTALTVKAFV